MFKQKNKILIRTFIALIFVFIATQLFVLNKVGTQGNKLNQIRIEQETTQLENEIIMGRIRELQSRGEVLKTVEQLQMNNSAVNYIDVDTRTRTALNN
jgi:hypothetical protein